MKSNFNYQHAAMLEYFSRNQVVPNEIEMVLDEYPGFFTQKTIQPVNMRFFTYDQNQLISRGDEYPFGPPYQGGW